MFCVKLHGDAFDVATYFSYNKVSNFTKVTSRHDSNGFRLFTSLNLLSK